MGGFCENTDQCIWYEDMGRLLLQTERFIKNIKSAFITILRKTEKKFPRKLPHYFPRSSSKIHTNTNTNRLLNRVRIQNRLENATKSIHKLRNYRFTSQRENSSQQNHTTEFHAKRRAKFPLKFVNSINTRVDLLP